MNRSSLSALIATSLICIAGCGGTATRVALQDVPTGGAGKTLLAVPARRNLLATIAGYDPTTHRVDTNCLFGFNAVADNGWGLPQVPLSVNLWSIPSGQYVVSFSDYSGSASASFIVRIRSGERRFIAPEVLNDANFGDWPANEKNLLASDSFVAATDIVPTKTFAHFNGCFAF